jgi:putative SOS response-associated peptidase YedK
MCCRYLLIKERIQPLLEKLGILLSTGTIPSSRFNISPGGPILAVRNRPGRPARSETTDTGRELASLHWGLIPSWARDSANPTVNARAETLSEKPTFRDAVRTRRCLIPASGFYEWEIIGRTRQPWLFQLHDERPFALAGLWERWRAPDGTQLESCAVVTSKPNSLMAPIHHRMPVILADPTAWEAWLDPQVTSVDTLIPHLQPFPHERMTATAVSAHVNNTRHDGPECIAPISPTGASGPQLSLGL